MATSSAIPAAGAQSSSGYQTMLVGLLGVNLGFVFLDRNAFGLLAPLIQPELGLSNTHIGMVNGILGVTWALSSFGLTRAADVTGRSKLLLIAATLIFSVATISSGLAIGLMTLLAARALMGLAEGGLPPLSTHIINSEVAPERRGLAIGMLSTLGIQAVPTLGPLVIVGLGTLYGWRHAFWIVGIPGLLMAAVMWLLIRNPPHQRVPDAPKGSIVPLFKVRNIRFTMVLATLAMTLYVGILGFLPLYLVNVAGLSNAVMGTVVTVQALVMIFYAFLGPTLSDRFGRKPVLIASYAIALCGFLILANSHGSLPLIFVGSSLAGGGVGAGILVMNVIPAESAPAHLRATAMGLNAAVGELLGAGAMPVAIGAVADRFGLATLPWILMAVAVLACCLTLGLRETAPERVAGAA